MSESSFPFNNDGVRLVAGQLSFFNSIFDPIAKTKKTIKFKDPETHVETEKLGSGDRKVTFVYVVDDDDNPANGRIYMRDEFILSSDRKYKSFNRKFSYNNKGSDRSSWASAAASYISTIKPSAGQTKEFSDKVAAVFPQKAKEAFISRMRKGVGYTTALKAGTLLNEVSKEKYGLRFYDEQSRYSVVSRGSNLMVTIVTVGDVDANPRNGRVLLRDTFVLDAQTKQYQTGSYNRRWVIAPESAGNSEAKSLVAELNKKSSASDAVGKLLAEHLVPGIFIRTKKSPSKPSSPPKAPPPVRPTPPPSKPKPGPSRVARSDPKPGSVGLDDPFAGMDRVPGPKVSAPGASSVKKPEYVFKFPAKEVGPRNVPAREMGKRIQFAGRPVMKMATRGRSGSFSIRTKVSIKVDNKTGNIVEVKFKDVEVSGMSQAEAKRILGKIAKNIYDQCSIKKHGEDDFFWIEFQMNFATSTQ